MSPLGKCIGIAAVIATVTSVVLGAILLVNAKIGSGIGKVFPFVVIAAWVVSFAPAFALTSISLYIRARRKKDSPARVRELGFATFLGLFALVVLGAAIITRLT